MELWRYVRQKKVRKHYRIHQTLNISPTLNVKENTFHQHQINAICRKEARGVRQNNKTIPAVHNNCYSLGGWKWGAGEGGVYRWCQSDLSLPPSSLFFHPSLSLEHLSCFWCDWPAAAPYCISQQRLCRRLWDQRSVSRLQGQNWDSTLSMMRKIWVEEDGGRASAW